MWERRGRRTAVTAVRGRVAFPVLDLALEDGADQRIEPGAAVEGSHQPFDHRLVDAGPRDDVLDDQITA
jgi:hypothetical protein